MLRVHDNVYAVLAPDEENGHVHLWQAQANDTYWHGLFGGIYMAHVRVAIYHHLIKAENIADRARHGTNHWQHYEFADFDRDTYNELIVESDQQNVYFDPQRGGTLFEWDMRRSAHNMSSGMTRRQESYHQTLREHEQERRRQNTAASEQNVTQTVGQADSEPASPHTAVRTKEPDLDRHLVIDRYRRNSLIDHFLPSGLTLPTFAEVRFEEQGNFVEQAYETKVEQDEQGLTITMHRDGQVRRAGALSPVPVSLMKTVVLPLGKEKLVIHYSIENKGQTRLQTQFGCEWNVNLLGGGGNDQAYYFVEGHTLENSHFDSTGEVLGVREVHIGNSWLEQDMGFSLSEAATLWRISVETVTGSEAGFERTHQGSSLTFVWPLLLDAGQTWHAEIVCTGSKP
ncbi:MAG: hypothetical protein NVS9B9_13120 [Ktedonobacteraceae bacterium]